MTGRTEWAVEAAGHLLQALRITQETPDIDAKILREYVDNAYRRSLYSIGSIPGDRELEVYELTADHGVGLDVALNAIGA